MKEIVFPSNAEVFQEELQKLQSFGFRNTTDKTKALSLNYDTLSNSDTYGIMHVIAKLTSDTANGVTDQEFMFTDSGLTTLNKININAPSGGVAGIAFDEDHELIVINTNISAGTPVSGSYSNPTSYPIVYNGNQNIYLGPNPTLGITVTYFIWYFCIIFEIKNEIVAGNNIIISVIKS